MSICSKEVNFSYKMHQDMEGTPKDRFAFYYVKVQLGKEIRPIACVCLGYDGQAFYRGVSICSEKDNFSYKLARNIAQGRCRQALCRLAGFTDGRRREMPIGNSGRCAANLFAVSTEYKIKYHIEAHATPASDHEKKIMEKLKRLPAKPKVKPTCYYILDKAKNVVACPSSIAWVTWITSHGCAVAKDVIGPDIFSTQFIGLDQNLCLSEKPAVFETVWFSRESKVVADRCFTSTWKEAEEAHARMLKRLSDNSRE